VPFTPYKTFQTSVELIEKLTDLSFSGGSVGQPQSLRRFDPLAQRLSKQAAHDGNPPLLLELTSFDVILLSE